MFSIQGDFTSADAQMDPFAEDFSFIDMSSSSDPVNIMASSPASFSSQQQTYQQPPVPQQQTYQQPPVPQRPTQQPTQQTYQQPPVPSFSKQPPVPQPQTYQQASIPAKQQQYQQRTQRTESLQQHQPFTPNQRGSRYASEPSKEKVAYEVPGWVTKKEGSYNVLRDRLKQIMATYKISRAPTEAKREELLNLLTTNEMIDQHWRRVLTHSSITQPVEVAAQCLFDQAEFLGDRILGGAFAMMLTEKFRNSPYFTADALTKLQNNYLSAGFQSEVADQMKLRDIFYYDPELAFSLKQRGDLLEAFCGGIALVAKANKLSAMDLLQNLLVGIFENKNEAIDISKIPSDPIAELISRAQTEGFTYHFYNESSDNPSLGENKVTLVINNFHLDPVYNDSLGVAKRQIFANGLAFLNEHQDFIIGRGAAVVAQQEAREEVAKEELKFRTAISTYNAVAAKKGLRPIVNYRIDQDSNNELKDKEKLNVQRIDITYGTEGNMQEWKKGFAFGSAKGKGSTYLAARKDAFNKATNLLQYMSR